MFDDGFKCDTLKVKPCLMEDSSPKMPDFGRPFWCFSGGKLPKHRLAFPFHDGSLGLVRYIHLKNTHLVVAWEINVGKYRIFPRILEDWHSKRDFAVAALISSIGLVLSWNYYGSVKSGIIYSSKRQ